MPQQTRYGDRAGDDPALDPATRAEQKRLAALFVLSAVTLLLFLAFVAAEGLGVDFIPPVVWAMWFASLLSGFFATWAFGVYVTVRARRWVWVALCAVPLTAVPCAVAYSWIRRGELELELHERRERPTR